MHRGSCRCGEVTIKVDGEPKWVANCHCNDCRKATGSAFATYVGCDDSQVQLCGNLARHASSPGVERCFCSACGSPIAYQGQRWPNEIHLFVGVFESAGDLRPKAHVYTAEALPWVFDLGALPRFLRTPSEDSGS